MARPLRIQYPGALYHVTTRGNAGGRIFRTDKDREYFLDLLGFIIERFHVLAELLNEEIRRNKAYRDGTIYRAHVTYGYTLKEIADHLRVHYTTISKIMNKHKRN
jgi:DNA-binding MarR family transcriptional regulator